MIRVDGLKKAYSGTPVLHGVCLEVRAGEVFGFVGPNGAGKTTLLKCLTGVARADAGALTIDGVDVRARPLEARRRIGYAPSETAMYDSFRVRAMLDFAIDYHPHADRERGRELLAHFRLPERARVRTLSHGMKRKLLLAQALASGAPVLLLDEPMEGLDPEARRDLESILVTEAAGGRTVFFSSHDLASVERVCERVAFLRGGHILECAPVVEVLERAGRSLSLRLREPRTLQQLPQGTDLRWSGDGFEWRLEFDGPTEDVLARLAALPIASLRDASGGLEEVFDALYGPEPSTAEAPQ